MLLLDEPAAGMNPSEKVELAHLVRRIRDERRVAVLLIEHDMKFVMGLSERIYVLDHGEPIASGRPEEIRANPRVIEAYLGAPAAEVAAPPARGRSGRPDDKPAGRPPSPPPPGRGG